MCVFSNSASGCSMPLNYDFYYYFFFLIHSFIRSIVLICVENTHCMKPSVESYMVTRAFITYVRPLLEYNCVVWSPHRKRDIELIEQVQRRFTKRLSGLSDYSYDAVSYTHLTLPTNREV